MKSLHYKLSFSVILMMILLIVGCSQKPKKIFTPEQAVDIIASGERQQLFDHLNKLETAVNNDDFSTALKLMHKSEREKILGEDGRITETAIRELKSLDYSKLINYPDIRLQDGYVTGVTNHFRYVDFDWPKEEGDSNNISKFEYDYEDQEQDNDG